MKLGRKPYVYDARDALYAQFTREITLPGLPSHFGHAHAFADWKVLGNDQYGDCVFAGADHEQMLWANLGKRSATFTRDNTLSDYAAVTGFDPVTGANDNGTNMRDACVYRKNTGVIDSVRKRHKIGAYVSLEPSNWHQMLEALYIFGAVGIGFNFPESAWDQWNQGKPWSYVPNSPIDGGHYVMVAGTPRPNVIRVITWGRAQEMTRGFYEHLVDEGYAMLSTEILNEQGKAPYGFDLAALRAYLAAL